jgi:6-methylsalicylate decarboxylase
MIIRRLRSGLSLARYFFASHRRRAGGAGDLFIDVHAHFLPAFYVDALARAGMTDIDGWPIPQWSEQAAIEVMDRHGIAAQVLSVSSPGTTFAQGKQAVDLARALNEYAAMIVRKHSPRFGALAVLPLPEVEASIAEIHHAFDTLGLDGVGLLSNYGGTYLGNARFAPIFAELDRRAAVVFVHPTQPPNFGPLSVGLPAPFMEYPFDSTRMACDLIKAGTIATNRRLRLIVAHGGGTIPYLYPRLIAGLGLNAAEAFRSFYYDITATTAPAQTTALLDVADASHCMLGFDFPFMEPKTISLVVSALHLADLSTGDLQSIRYGNAARLFPHVVARLASRKR